MDGIMEVLDDNQHNVSEGFVIKAVDRHGVAEYCA
jgi:hypothetical protein